MATKQYEQKACPFSGGKLNPETAVSVAGVKVCFCCNNCKGKVEGADDDAAKVKMIFANKASLETAGFFLIRHWQWASGESSPADPTAQCGEPDRGDHQC